jgi:hypothetical protein
MRLIDPLAILKYRNVDGRRPMIADEEDDLGSVRGHVFEVLRSKLELEPTPHRPLIAETLRNIDAISARLRPTGRSTVDQHGDDGR